MNFSLVSFIKTKNYP